jgi:DNA repair photolyase
MHKVMAKSLLSPGNGMNLYRGCTHGCIYCDSRSKCYGMDHIFEDIEVKENALQLLERALKAKRKPCMIGTGSMSDPYIHQEMELYLMGRSLELIEKYGFGVAVQTKSDRILRDLELYRRINEKTKAVVQMTLTTADDELCRILEPNVAVTSRRVAVLKAFREAGVPTVVWLCPVLPFLTDTEENIRAIVELCADAGVTGIVNFGMGLTLREGNREYFYSCLDRNFPGLKEQYIRKYGNTYEIPSPHQKHLLEVFHKTCEEKGICHENQRIFAYLREFEGKRQPQQLSFL